MPHRLLMLASWHSAHMRRALTHLISLSCARAGLGLIVVFCLGVIYLLGNYIRAGFYRRHPFVNNILTIALECYSIATSVWFMIVRALTLIFMCALYLGRIDITFLAPGVGSFGEFHLPSLKQFTEIFYI